MKEVIIHMGFHKTASSSIQGTCANNRKLLEKRGVYYPVFKYEKKNITNHSIPIFSLFTSSPQNFHINIKWGVDSDNVNLEYRRQLDRIVSNENKILLSGESMSILPEESLFSLKQYFVDNGFRITPVAFVRSPISHQISAAQERVKNGSTLRFSENHFPCSKIKKLQSVFSGDIRFFPFRKVCSCEYGPVGFFLNMIGVTEDELKKIKYSQSNPSMSDQATRLIAYINEREPFYTENKTTGKREVNPNRINHDTAVFQDIGNGKYKPALPEIRHILEKAKQENDWLKENLGEEYCDDEKDLEFNDHPLYWNRENIKQFVNALAKCPLPLRNIAVDFIDKQVLSGQSEKAEFRNMLDGANVQLK